jgi:hypothetical protein
VPAVHEERRDIGWHVRSPRPPSGSAGPGACRGPSLRGIHSAVVHRVRRRIPAPHTRSRKEQHLNTKQKFNIASSPGPFVFPHVCAPGCKAPRANCPGPAGMMRADVALESVLRRAMARAGLVTGYTHVWRREGCRYREEAPDAELHRCLEHRHALWPKPNARPLRFHDLRHTCASLLLQAGVPIAVVQRILRHRDPRLTSEIYGHLAPDYLQAEIGRLRLFREDETGELLPLEGASPRARTAPALHSLISETQPPEPNKNSSATPAAFGARDTGFEPVAFGSGGGGGGQSRGEQRVCPSANLSRNQRVGRGGRRLRSSSRRSDRRRSASVCCILAACIRRRARAGQPQSPSSRSCCPPASSRGHRLRYGAVPAPF